MKTRRRRVKQRLSRFRAYTPHVPNGAGAIEKRRIWRPCSRLRSSAGAGSRIGRTNLVPSPFRRRTPNADRVRVWLLFAPHFFTVAGFGGFAFALKFASN